jgi:hypothetical protein
MQVKELMNAIKSYSEYSTIQGIVYIFQSKQTVGGKIFWILVVSFFLFLGVRFSQSAFTNWKNSPVLTTLTSTAHPIKKIDFPAFTICGQGMNDDVLYAGMTQQILNFFQKIEGVTFNLSAFQTSNIMNKKVIILFQ